MKINQKKLLLWGAIVIPLGLGMFALMRWLKNKPPAKQPDSVSDSTASKPKIANAATNTFPIKQGSRGELVRQLQAHLGVSADGVFGPKTLAALLAATGKSQISNQEEFNAVITKLQSKTDIKSSQARATDLVNRWNNSTAVLIAITDVKAYQVVKDIYGALTSAGKSITLYPNTRYNRNDYVLIGNTTSGYLLFQITKGALAGLYKVDPNKVSLA